jgi:U3 small nucleolar RNA-associated protein 14
MLPTCSTSASEDEQQQAGGSGGMMSSRSRKEALAILRGLADPAAAGDSANGLAGSGDAAASGQKKGLFALPFMVRALEKQRAAAAQEAAAMLAGMEAGAADGAAADDFGAAGDDDGFGGGGAAAGRISFGGKGPGAAAAAAARAAAAAAAEDMSGSDDVEDVDAKAARLSRHLAGEAGDAAAAAAAQQAAVDKRLQKQQVQSAANGAGQQQQLQQQAGADIGYVEVDLPTGSTPGKGIKAAKKAAAAAAAAAGAGAGAGAANGVLPDAHAGLFGKKQQQQQLGVGGAAEQPSSSQPAAFLASTAWQGPKPGYVFKKDKQGVGYYLDKQQQQQQGRKKGKGKSQQQQQQQVLLQRQQEAGNASSSDDEGGTGDAAAAAAAGKQQQRQRQQQAGEAGAAAAAAAGVDAMQLLSGEGDLQRQLLAAAFAGDDVEGEFEAAKAAEVAAELPSAEVEGQLPGWGTWSGQQREPAWMAAARAKAAAQRDSAAAERKDAGMKHVVISEKWDKKAAKYHASALPFPFKDKGVYESAMRQPLGRQFNPDAAFRNLTRPAVLKDTGVVIQPLRFSKQVEKYNAAGGGKARAVVTVAGGMQLQGQAAGSGAGGVGKGGGQKKGKQGSGKQAAASAQKRVRLHDGAGR